MKPFNLEEYLNNPNRELITRGGRKARIICTDRKDADYPIVALVLNELETREGTMYYTVQGKFYQDNTSSFDLFFAPEKKVGWVNIYRECCGPITSTHVFSSKEEAEKASMHCNGFTQGLHLATVKIEWEE